MRNLFAVILVCILSVYVSSSHASIEKGEVKSYSTKKYKKKYAKGLKKSSRKILEAMRHVSFMNAPKPIPSTVDLSQKVSPPENQGNCGSCWDFSLSKALRSEFMLSGYDPGQLEFNYLLNNCGPGPKMYGCNGGDFIAAKSLTNFSGPGLNSVNPYTQRSSNHCSNQAVRASAISYSMLGSGKDGPTFKDIAYAVGVERHMLSIDVAAGSGDWADYSDGIYDHCSRGPVDHMINLVGFSCETSHDAQGNCLFNSRGRPVNGDGYLIVQNNWGEEWGIHGYMKTRMYDRSGVKCNSIASDALMFIVSSPKPDPQPSKAPEPSAQSQCKGFLCDELGCWIPWCKQI